MAVPDEVVPEEEVTFKQRCHPGAGAEIKGKGSTLTFSCFACKREFFQLTLGLEVKH